MLKQPVLDIAEGQITGDVFTLSESDGTGGEAGLVFNTPLIQDELACAPALIITVTLDT